jgi:uncharacterized membrane protein YfcA
MDAIWIGYLAVGAGAGFLGGLLGIGGGLVVVPALITLFARQGFPAEMVVPLAMGTSLATILFTSCSSVWAHHRQSTVDWGFACRLGPGVVTGALGGTLAVALIPAGGLKLLFAAYAVWAAIRMFEFVQPRTFAHAPGQAGLTAAGGLIGSIAALAGTGAGATAVPFMVACRIPLRTAIGTAAALGIPMAVAGTAGYAMQGLERFDLPAGCLGLVYVPAVAAIAAVSVMTAPLGAKLSHRLPLPVLKRTFAVVLIVVAAKTLLGA